MRAALTKPKLRVDLLLEEWRDIRGWEKFYAVSNYGCVKRKARKAAKQYWYKGKHITNITEKVLCSGNRRYVDLERCGRRERYSIAELVLNAFVGARPSRKHVARHLNDVHTDNVLTNLAWGTRRDNRLDAVRNGKQSAGSEWAKKVAAKLRGQKRSPEQIARIRAGRERYFKLTKYDVQAIKQLLNSGEYSGSAIGAMFGVSRFAVYAIRDGRIWSEA